MGVGTMKTVLKNNPRGSQCWGCSDGRKLRVLMGNSSELLSTGEITRLAVKLCSLSDQMVCALSGFWMFQHRGAACDQLNIAKLYNDKPPS